VDLNYICIIRVSELHTLTSSDIFSPRQDRVHLPRLDSRFVPGNSVLCKTKLQEKLHCSTSVALITIHYTIRWATDSCITCYHLAQGLFIALMMEAVLTSETSVYYNETTLLYIPEDSNLQRLLCFCVLNLLVTFLAPIRIQGVTPKSCTEKKVDIDYIFV
jgi:hypothetical protein